MLKHRVSFFDSKNPNYSRNKVSSYIILLFFVLIISNFILSSFGLQDNEANSTRYLVSALIQSESAILAIVVTLSIFAIQQASSTYSARLIQVFKDPKKNPDFYVIVFTYITTIIYGCWVLKQVRGEENDIIYLKSIIFSSFDTHIWITYALGIFSLISLIPYSIHTMNLLNPTTIIDKLSIDISETNLESMDEEDSEKKQNNDVILPIIDIIRKSLIEYDYKTSRIGLETMTGKVKYLLNADNLSEKNKEKLLNSFFPHVLELGRLAAANKDELFVIDLLDIMDFIGELRNKNPKNRRRITTLVEEIGIESVNQKLERATKRSVVILEKIVLSLNYVPGSKIHQGEIISIFSSTLLIGEIAVRHKMKRPSSQVFTSLNKIIEPFILENLDTAEKTNPKYLEHKRNSIKYLLDSFYRSLSDVAFETKSNSVLTLLSFYLMVNAGHIIARKLDDEIPLNILEWMVEIGEFAAEDKAMKNLVRNNIDHIDEIFNTAIQYENYSVALVAADSEVKLKPKSYDALIKKGNCYRNFKFNMKAIYAYEKANEIKETHKAWKGIEKAWSNIGNYSSAEKARDAADELTIQEADNNYFESL